MLRLLVVCLFLSGCMLRTPMLSPEARTQQADHLAKTVGWKQYTIHTPSFTLKAYGSHAKGNTLTVYIEGDGLAWISSDTVSDNPTPMAFTGLKIAIHHQQNHPMVYLARPCQLVFNNEWKGCQPAYWTNLRFSPEVIHAMNQAMDDLKKYYHAKKIVLIGYSGGGTVAALMAARRNDVVKLITIAAVLDVDQWVRQENLTPLTGSLNPADEWGRLMSIPQIHWVGGKDTVVPKEIAFSYANHFPSAKKPEVKVVPDFDHTCCWATDRTFA